MSGANKKSLNEPLTWIFAAFLWSVSWTLVRGTFEINEPLKFPLLHFKHEYWQKKLAKNWTWKLKKLSHHLKSACDNFIFYYKQPRNRAIFNCVVKLKPHQLFTNLTTQPISNSGKSKSKVVRNVFYRKPLSVNSTHSGRKPLESLLKGVGLICLLIMESFSRFFCPYN